VEHFTHRMDKNATSSDCLHLRGCQCTARRVLNKLIHTFLAVSDLNCSTFLHRGFANRPGMQKVWTVGLQAAIKEGRRERGSVQPHRESARL